MTFGHFPGLVATRRSVCIHQMNRVNSRSDHGHDDGTINIVVDYYYYYKTAQISHRNEIQQFCIHFCQRMITLQRTCIAFMLGNFLVFFLIFGLYSQSILLNAANRNSVVNLEDVQQKEDEISDGDGSEVDCGRVAGPHSSLHPDTGRQRVADDADHVPDWTDSSVQQQRCRIVNLYTQVSKYTCTQVSTPVYSSGVPRISFWGYKFNYDIAVRKMS